MTKQENPENQNIRYAVDELPPHPLSAGLGFQVVILVLAGIALTPIIVLRAAGGADDYMAWVVFAALLISGITTILQVRPLGPFGAGYVLFMGTSGAFIAVSISAVQAGGLALLASLVVLSSLVQFLFASHLGWLRKVVTPTIGGTVIMLIAVTVFPIVFKMLGQVPAHFGPDSSVAPVTAAVTFLASVGITLFASGRMRLWGPLLGVITGCAVAAFYGLIDFGPVWDAPLIGIPAVGLPGFDTSFDARFWGLFPAFVIVTVVGAIETFGDGIAIQRVSTRVKKPVDFKSVQGAVYADGLGNLLSGLMGTMPNTTYSTSISVADLTGVAARRVGLYGGAFLTAIAFSPKVSALLQLIPNPVLAAYATILLVLLFGHGLRLVFEGGLNYENGIIVCLAFWLGVGFQNGSIFGDRLPEWAASLLGNGMTSGGLVALVLSGILALKNRSKDRLSIEASTAGIPPLHDFLHEFAGSLGWDQGAISRLQLAGEEAVLFLISEDTPRDVTKDNRIQVFVREMAGTLEVEFVAAPADENLEGLVQELRIAAEPSPEEAGLRILSHLVSSVRHLQFHGGDYLMITVESTPLN